MTAKATVQPYHFEAVRIVLKHDTPGLYEDGVSVLAPDAGDIIYDWWLEPVTDFDGGSGAGITLGLYESPILARARARGFDKTAQLIFNKPLDIAAEGLSELVQDTPHVGHRAGGAEGVLTFIGHDMHLVAIAQDNANYPDAPDPLPTVGEIAIGLIILKHGAVDG